jgi:hypothetical protein
MFDEALTPEQLIVVNALTEGLNSTDAAAQAGVHRNTIANWRRNSLFFRESLADAQYDRALLFRDKTEEMLDLAFQTLDSLLGDPKASPSVRLKAALFIIAKAITPPQPRKQVPFDISEVRVHKAPVAAPALAQNTQNVHKMHNDAQSEPAPAEPIPAQTFRRETPKVGRNKPCPCGSGQKFKRCCLNKPQTNTHGAAA